MSQRERERNRPGRNRAAGAAPAPVTPQSLLAEAETLQQRAERRSGQDALPALAAAAAKYQEAIEAGLSAQEAVDVHFGLGECLQMWADTQLQVLQQAADEVLSNTQHCQQIQEHVRQLYHSSVQAYQQVPSESSADHLRSDAAVNAANSLSSWAELVTGPRQLQLMEQAVQLYRSALAQEEDALTLSNLGDVLVSQGEALLESGQSSAGQTAFQSAIEAYQSSCSMSDSSAGDDLPGLLYNWGVGLHTISKHAQDGELKKSLLQQAAEKLRASIQFSRADPTPHNALGDVLMDAAELLILHSICSSSNASDSSESAGGSSSVFGGSEPLAAVVADQAAALIEQAVNDGYMAALTIKRTNADALVGLAEASTAMAKLANRQGETAAATQHINAALGHYTSALARPELLGDATERADARYNAACAAALAGRADLAEQLLRMVAAAGRLQVNEVAADDDLAGLRGLTWFQGMLQPP